ncbi:MAG: 23S rRNA (guanosine(2251)-2'-O)-methyltransferase RlmB [Gammaproteobacteria bacterium]|nr:23S rRNA (guanosine(2251)-2'-O)-methyltransferase RlmB [Gammaproteobacteria bacterium]
MSQFPWECGRVGVNRNVFGLHAVAALLEHEPGRVTRLWVLESRKDARLNRLVEVARKRGVPINESTRVELDSLAEGARHQGVVAAYAGESAPLGEADLERLLDAAQGPALVLVLDGVQDPHNLGACLRTADAAGVHAVVAPRDRAVGLTPAVLKVASGAAESVPFVQVTNLARTLRALKDRGLQVVGAAGGAEQPLFAADLSGPLALVMGGEGGGLRRLTREQCDALVRVPMAGTVESLNVSVAAGVCLYEAVRQRS